MKASQITSTQVTIGLGLVGVLAVYLVGRQAMKAAGSVGDAVSYGVQQITPWNPENVFYKGASSIGDSIAGDGRSAPLGVRLWEWANPDKVAAEKAVTAPQQATRSVAEVGYWTPDGMVDAMGNYTGDYARSSGGATGNW